MKHQSKQHISPYYYPITTSLPHPATHHATAHASCCTFEGAARPSLWPRAGRTQQVQLSPAKNGDIGDGIIEWVLKNNNGIFDSTMWCPIVS